MRHAGPLLAAAVVLVHGAASADEAAAPAHASHAQGAQFLNLFALGAYAVAAAEVDEPRIQPLEDHFPRAFAGEKDEHYRTAPRVLRYRRRHESREGMLFSLGFGGGSLNVTGTGKTGAFDFGMRLGYGLSDRLQLFGDITVDAGTYAAGRGVTSWLLTARGQTVLIGDRDGNGLNLNLGFGLGGLSRDFPGRFASSDSGAGFALVSGLSYDARVGYRFSLSPELFVSWHQVLNGPGFENDAATTVGLRLNFLWYAP